MTPPPYTLTPYDLLQAYANGIFPMADSKNAEDIFWVDPKIRAILPLHQFHLPHSLRKFIKRAPFDIRINTCFETVMRACANRKDTWINDIILHAYTQLHKRGFAHSIEIWQAEQLVGGLYGVQINAAFFGESMFSTQDNASKFALAYLVARLRQGGFQLLDCQFQTAHLARFGTIEIPRTRYHDLLRAAIEEEADFYSLPVNLSPDSVLQLIGHIS